MNSFVLTIRAIGAEFAMRLFIPIVIIVAATITLVGVGAWWLTTFSSWWWLLFVPLVILASVAIGIGFVVFSLIRFVRPSQTKTQKQAVKAFSSRLQGVAEIAATPKFLIFFHVIRSISAPSKDTFLTKIVQNKELVSDFRAIQRSFEP
jgi:hypothetical protein